MLCYAMFKQAFRWFLLCFTWFLTPFLKRYPSKHRACATDLWDRRGSARHPPDVLLFLLCFAWFLKRFPGPPPNWDLIFPKWYQNHANSSQNALWHKSARPPKFLQTPLFENERFVSTKRLLLRNSLGCPARPLLETMRFVREE